jgi:hypothetical protein
MCHDEVDRQERVKTLAEACQTADWQETVRRVKRVAARVPLGSDHTGPRNLHAWMTQEGKRKVNGSENSNKVWLIPLTGRAR